MIGFLLGILAGNLLWIGVLLCFYALRVKEKAMEEAKRIQQSKDAKEAKEAKEAEEAQQRPKVFHFRRTGRIRPSRTTLTDRYRAFLLE